MRGFVAANVDEDLRHFLKDVRILIPVEFDYVLADVIEFTSSVISEGLPKALAEALTGSPEQVDRPYVDICDALAERHVRSVPEPQRSVAKKSLFETYVYFGGPQHVFETADKTRLYQTLRRRQQKGFAASFLSLYLFNFISLQIRDDLSSRIPEVRNLELYMLSIEAKCREFVRRVIRNDAGNELSESWPSSVRQNIEIQLLGKAGDQSQAT